MLRYPIEMEINEKIQIPDNEIEFSFSRSSGAGGQNVNKVSSRATLRWNVTATTSLPYDVKQRFLTVFASKITNEGEILISSDNFRDQPRNIEDCKMRLTEMILAVEKPPKKRVPTKPSRANKAKRVESKRAHSDRKKMRQKKFDY